MQIVIMTILLKSLLKYMMNIFHLKKKSKNNRNTIPQSPWITKGLLKRINVKTNYTNNIFCVQLGFTCKTYRNKLNNLIRKSKREYYHKQFERTYKKITSGKRGKQQTVLLDDTNLEVKKLTLKKSGSKVLLKLMMVILLLSKTKYLIYLMTSL